MINYGKKVFAVFLDVAKAFDTIHHDVLPSFGIPHRSLICFKSHLARKQVVELNDVVSDGEILEYGDLQGSLLCPILFIVYIINAVCELNIYDK